MEGKREGSLESTNGPPPFTLVQKNVLTVREVLKRIVFDKRDTFNSPNLGKHAAHAKKPEMESVGSGLPRGAAPRATGGEKFGEVSDSRQTDRQTDN